MNLSVFVFMQPLLWSTSYSSPPSLSHDPSPHSNTTVDTPFSYTADNTATRGRPARKGSLFHAGSTSSKGVRDFKLEVYKWVKKTVKGYSKYLKHIYLKRLIKWKKITKRCPNHQIKRLFILSSSPPPPTPITTRTTYSYAINPHTKAPRLEFPPPPIWPSSC